MKINRRAQLLDYLITKSNSWIPAKELSDKFSVSTRQIRKYILSFNEICDGFKLIESSSKGYCLNADYYFLYKEKADCLNADTPDTRYSYIIQKLVCFENGYNIFDISEELFVSIPTIENDLKTVRNLVKDYSLSLKREKEMLRLAGSETSKRNMMSHLISSGSYDNFVLKDEVRLLTFHYHFWDFRKNIKDILINNEVFANDYALNNIALHLIVMIDRIKNNCLLEESFDTKGFSELPQYKASKCIASYIENTYELLMNETELYNLALTVTNNTSTMDYSFVDSGNIEHFVEQKYIAIAADLLEKVAKRYYLNDFDQEFTTRFTLHIKNLFQRIQNHYYANNPLTAKIKLTYPLIYDISVFIAQEFKTEYDIFLNEDEIAYFAFHIGSYFENNVHNKNKVTCMFIYADYYSSYKHILEKIERIFEDKILLKYAISVPNYAPALVHADLIISTVELPFTSPAVIINPFFKEKDLNLIQDAVETIDRQKRNLIVKDYLLDFVNAELFCKDYPYSNREDMIRYMTKKVISLGYADERLTEDVLAREYMSCTAFHQVAVPHSLAKNIKHSFISFAISEVPMQWGNSEISMIVLIGVSEESRKLFAQVFDHLISILSETSHIKILTQAANYKEFMQHLIHLMDHYIDE